MRPHEQSAPFSNSQLLSFFGRGSARPFNDTLASALALFPHSPVPRSTFHRHTALIESSCGRNGKSKPINFIVTSSGGNFYSFPTTSPQHFQYQDGFTSVFFSFSQTKKNTFIAIGLYFSLRFLRSLLGGTFMLGVHGLELLPRVLGRGGQRKGKKSFFFLSGHGKHQNSQINIPQERKPQ